VASKTSAVVHDFSPTFSPLFPALVALGIGLRLVLAFNTIGTNDMVNWEKFARAIAESGLLNLYAADPDFNHPPIMGLGVLLLVKIADLIGAPFYAVFKGIVVLGDCASILLLFRMWRRRGSTTVAWQVAALYSLSLLSILVSGYHGNTDSLYGFGALLALSLFEQRKMLLSGLTLAAALNVKLIPVVLVIPFVLSHTGWRELFRWSWGFALGLLPFAVVTALSSAPFIQNVFLYKPFPENWGLIFFLRLMRANNPEYAPVLGACLDTFIRFGRYLTLGLIFALTVFNRRSRRLDLAQLLAVSAALFLIFASGFGLQYFALLATLAFAAEPRWGFRLSAVTGVSALLTYGYFLVSLSPALSIHNSSAPKGVAFVFTITWLIIIFFAGDLLFVRKSLDRRGKTPEADVS